MESRILIYLMVVGVSIFGFYVLFFFVPIGIWITARIAGVKISLLELIYMKMCRVAPAPIVRSMIMAAKAGIEIRMDDLEAHSQAGGNVENVVTGMIIAKNKNEHLSFQEACRRDLASKDFTDGM